MITFEGLTENFKFLVFEVTRQVRATREFLKDPSRELYVRITSRDDYIDNLKTIIENKCYSKIHADKSLDTSEVNRIRATQVCCVNLERIADYFVNIARQMEHLSEPAFLQQYDYGGMFDVCEQSLEKILDVARDEDLPGALAICKSEFELDRLYKESFDRIMRELGGGRSPQDHVTAIFIFRYLERAGDALLNVGEALIFSILGEKIKIEQFEALQQTLTKSGFAGSLGDIDFKSIWGSRSGCRIGRVEGTPDAVRTEGPAAPAPQDGKQDTGSIYKEGAVEKIRREKANIERWASIFPGLVAGIYGYHEDGDKAALLVEFLSGCTMDEILLTADPELMRNAMFILLQTVREIWETTRSGPVPTDYMRQLRSRLDDVRQVHPEFNREAKTMGRTRVLSSDELLNRCAELEAELEAPFAVFTHGDFNVNNVVYDHAGQNVRFIDLYRSRDYDYVQDASVFLVSNFRMPVFEPVLRDRLNWAVAEFYDFAKTFAETNGDETFEARMAFALARSFYTSTRFELNNDFAREMFLRSHYLLERLVAQGDRPWNRFRLPTDILYY